MLAGGRYDSLISQMGGPDTPGIGWAAGIERLELLVKIKADPNRPISIIPVSDNLANQALSLADRLRHEGFKIELGYSGNLGKRMKRANKLDACAVILLGDTEISRNIGLVKDMDSGEQIEVSLENLVDHLEKYRLTGTTSGNCQS